MTSTTDYLGTLAVNLRLAADARRELREARQAARVAIDAAQAARREARV